MATGSTVGDTIAALASGGGDPDKALGTVGALAAMYAYAEAYSQYYAKETGSNSVLEAFHSYTFDDIDTIDDATQEVVDAFTAVQTNGASKFADYLTGQWEKDLKGYTAAMQAVSESKDAIAGNLASDECYTDGTVGDLVTAYMSVGSMEIEAGQAAVVVNKAGDNFSVVAYPTEFGQ